MLIRACAILSLTAGLAAPASTPALAQNALGDGRGLQKNTNKYDASKGPVNRGYDKDAARFRNAIVFGNAPGGSQRSSTLQDSSQFMGTLGSDTLYSFRRDSYYSGLAGRGIRGTEALQYQFALTTGGSTRGSSLTGAGFVARDPSATGASIDGFSQPSGIQRRPTWLTDSARAGDTLRSTASFTSASALRPSLIGEGVDENGRRFNVAASPLLGLQTVRRSVASPLITPVGETPAEPPAADPRSAAAGGPENTSASRSEPKEITIYDSLARRLAERGKALPAQPDQPSQPTQPDATQPLPTDNADFAKPKWLRDIEALKQSLSERDTPAAPGQPRLSGPTPPGLGKPPPGMRYDVSGKLVPLIDKGVTDFIRDASTAGSRFIKQETDDASAFTQSMRQGEALLARNQFFAAEEKFARALTLRPGDVTALVARTHAQISGGLFVSAANNLRELLTSHPEIAATRYAKELVSTDERAAIVKTDLEARMGLNAKSLGALGLQPVRDAGLIYAYFCYQLGDTAGVDRGINAMLSRIPDKDEPSLADQRLALFCRGVWLATPAESVPPAIQPAVPPAAEPSK